MFSFQRMKSQGKSVGEQFIRKERSRRLGLVDRLLGLEQLDRLLDELGRNPADRLTSRQSLP